MFYYVACGAESEDSDARTSTNVKNSFPLTSTKTWQAFLQGTSVLHVIQY